MRMLFNLEKTQRERDDLKNQLAHQNLQPKPKRPSQGNSEWCTRHMSIEKDRHDVILEYVKELTKGKFNRNPEWDEGFETERWYNLDDRETTVCNYYVFEYIITVCVYVCVCARVRVFQYVTTLHSMFSLYSHFGMRWSWKSISTSCVGVNIASISRSRECPSTKLVKVWFGITTSFSKTNQTTASLLLAWHLLFILEKITKTLCTLNINTTSLDVLSAHQERLMSFQVDASSTALWENTTSRQTTRY